MPYNVELCYGYFEGECGIYHAFRLVAPEKDFPDDVEKSLAESLETKADNPNFKWDCMHLNLPDAIVERIKADGVREYSISSMTAEGIPNSAFRINRATLLFWRRFHSAVTSMPSRSSKPIELNEAS